MVSVVSAAFLDKWLLLYYAMLLDRVFRRTTWQKQIDIVPYLILGLHTSNVPLAFWSNTPTQTSTREGQSYLDRASSIGIRVGTLSHDALISICIFTVFPTLPSAFQLSYNVGTNLQRRSDDGA